MPRRRPATASRRSRRARIIRSRRNTPTRCRSTRASRRRSTGIRSTGCRSNSIRIFNAYGTRSRTSGAYGAVFGVFLRQKLAGKPFTVVGDGTQRRDFLYVTDVARAFLAAAETSHTGRVWNLGAGNPQSVNRLVELLGGEMVHIPKRPGEPDCTWADIARITRELGWRPRSELRGGRRQDRRRHRLLARRAALGSGVDRQGDEDLVRVPWLANAFREMPCCRRSPRSTATRSRPSRSSATSSGRGRARRRSSCATACSTSCIRGTCAICSTPRARPTSWSRASPPTPHQQGATPAVRAAGPARAQPRGVRDGRLRGHRPERDADREHRAPPARLLRQGLRVHARAACTRRRRRRSRSLQAYGGEMIFTPGDIVYSSSRADRARAADRSEREAAHADGQPRAHLRRRCARRSTSSREFRVHVVGDTIVDSYTQYRDDRRHDEDADDERALRADATTTSAARGRRQAPARGRRRGHLLDRARRRRAQGLRARGPEDARRATAARSSTRRGRPRTRTRSSPAATACSRSTRSTTARSPTTIVEPARRRRSRDVPADAVVFSDFRHGIFNRRTIPQLVAAIPDGTLQGRRQPGREPLGQHPRVQGLRSDHAERARGALRARRPGFGRPAARARALYDAAQCKTLILKLGERGVLTCRSSDHESLDSFFVVDSFADRVVDAVGAGDALLAYATLAMLATGSDVIATILGSMAAACECEHRRQRPGHARGRRRQDRRGRAAGQLREAQSTA